MSVFLHRCLIVVGLVAGLSGCTAPEYATVEWSRKANVCQPAAPDPHEIKLFEGRDGKGRLVIRTGDMNPHQEFELDHRGFAVFDARGELVSSSHGYDGEADSIFLEPGNYIVVSIVERGAFDRVRESLQTRVAPRASTLVDFRVLELSSR